ncbi:MAG: hypothetical protein RJA07_1476 [Bacteroidota bacterium]|jgi:hypothetical protein
MKNNFIFLVFIILLFSNNANAQTTERPSRCNTELSKTQADWLDAYQRNDGLPQYRKKKNTTIYIPIKAHIVGNDDHTGYYPLQKLFDDICDLNMRFTRDSINFHFFLYQDIDYINNTLFYNDASETNPMADSIMQSSKHFTLNAINIFFVNGSPGLCGYYSPTRDVVVLIGACGGKNSTVLTHDIGHYFSLPHTFQNIQVYDSSCWNQPSAGYIVPQTLEKMDGSNCHAVADKFCDTPPDYNIDRVSCISNHCRYKDPNGVPLNTDSSLYMSNFDDICLSKFSKEQIAAMQASLDTFHFNWHLNLPQNSTQINDTIGLITPNGETLPADFINFKWHSVAGATKYCVAVYKQGNNTNQVWSKITSDTTANIYANDNLKESVFYKWLVVAFNPAATCSSFYTNTHSFITSKALSTNDLSNNSYIKIFPNPASNYFLVNFVAENNAGYNLSVMDLNGKILLNKSIHSTIGSEVVETSNWASGEYFVQLRNADNKILKTEKVMVSK